MLQKILRIHPECQVLTRQKDDHRVSYKAQNRDVIKSTLQTACRPSANPLEPNQAPPDRFSSSADNL